MSRLIRAPEGQILNKLNAVSRLKWYSFQKRFYAGTPDGADPPSDESHNPPHVVFRFREEDTKIVDVVRQAVEKFEGAVRWALDGYKCRTGGTNWVICPHAMIELGPKARKRKLPPNILMSIEMPEVARSAYDDCEALANYVAAALEAAD
jgi:hypothetical protein